MSREALLKLFAVPPPTIEEILEQERQEKGLSKEDFLKPSYDLNGPLSQNKTSKRKLSDLQRSSTASTSSKKSNNNSDASNISSNINKKRKEVESLLDDVTNKKLKPSAEVSPVNTTTVVIPPTSTRKLTDPRRSNTTSNSNVNINNNSDDCNTSWDIINKRPYEVASLFLEIPTKKLISSVPLSSLRTTTVIAPRTATCKLSDPRRSKTTTPINQNIKKNNDVCNTSSNVINKRRDELERLFYDVPKPSPVNTVPTPVASPVSAPMSSSPLSPSRLAPGEFFSLDDILTAVKTNNEPSVPVVTSIPAPVSNMPPSTEVLPLPFPRPDTPPLYDSMRSPSPPLYNHAVPPPYPLRSSMPAMNAPGNANAPKKKKRNRRNKKAQVATRNHVDRPKVKAIEDVDFDTLLKQHEMAAAKSQEKELKKNSGSVTQSTRNQKES